MRKGNVKMLIRNLREMEENKQCTIQNVVESATPLKECMAGRDGECWHPKCPVTMKDAKNGKYCQLPLCDYRE